MTIAIEALESIREDWREEFYELRNKLEKMGHKADTAEYSVVSIQAMRLMQCIEDVSTAIAYELKKKSADHRDLDSATKADSTC